MQRLKVSVFFLLVCVFMQTRQLHAQSTGAEDIVTWFLEERFIITDENDDALLSKNEMALFPAEFGFYLEGDNYKHSDSNLDGFLSFREINSQRMAEFNFRNVRERQQIERLREQQPDWLSGDSNYLRSHPVLSAKLMENLRWMMANTSVAASLYTDQKWCEANPGVQIALHKNLRWMLLNPEAAKTLYKNRPATRQLPELLSWRADHLAFMRHTPAMDPSAFPADFVNRN